MSATEPKPPVPPGTKGSDWERDLINRLAFASLNEQRRSRRWGIFFKLLLFVYLFSLLFLYLVPEDSTGLGLGKHTALVEVNGLIADDAKANAEDIIKGLKDAFEDTHTAGVILRINSPGGSAVQSAYVNDEIWRLRKKYPKTPIYAVLTDLCASGGYYIAAATQKIYANNASLVGSIGVRMGGFGFVDAINKLGIERRLYTAGEHKGFMDPFEPMKEDDVAHIKGMLEDIHGKFIAVVKKGRGDRLKDDPKLFSGWVWTGDQAKALGLVDELASASYVAREVIGVEKIKDFTHRGDYWERLAERLGAAGARTLAEVASSLGTPR